MSVSFASASSERLELSSAPVTDAPITFACWHKTGLASSYRVLMSIGNSTSGSARFGLELNSSNKYVATARTSGSANATGATSINTSDVWQHAMAIFFTSTDRRVYYNGTEDGTSTTDRSPAGMNKSCIGGRIVGSSIDSEIDGELAEVGIWNVGLDAGERAALAAGISPELIRPSALVAYLPLVTNTYIDKINGLWTANGTPTTDIHPKIIYPSAQILQFPATAAAGSTPIHFRRHVGFSYG